MKRDFRIALYTFSGAPMSLRNDAEGQPVPATVGDIAIEALTSPKIENGQPQTMTGIDHVKAYSLAQRIFEATDDVELTVEEVMLIKTRVSEHYVQPLLVGQVLLLLEDGERN
ncbi:hypothetical protein [Aureimonas sp. AU12]|uniref:hypothetical protein n=1 Tax=Aureimonas sp. AU12 TaxID=1638161 RepID=UPI000AFEBD35|nr:hypothetical protein [Aureimonas sp. AU12]